MIMRNIINEYLRKAKVGSKQSYKNLAIYPLLYTYSIVLDYILLDEALKEALIDVVEVDEAADVPNLKFINKSERMVLILDGEELVGAKQNRIVNTTILIPGNATVVIPVSCVEQGRWHYDAPQFRSEERLMAAGMRAKKVRKVSLSLKQDLGFRADQGEIWDGIAQIAQRRDAVSPSMAMSEIYEKDRSSIEEYMRKFKLIDSQVGAVFMINGKVVGLDSLGKPGSFSKIFNKLVESYALDAIDWFDSKKEHKALRSDVTKFLKASQKPSVETHEGVGLGTDCRLESDKVIGFALAMDEQILHLSVFARGNGQEPNRPASRMANFRQRRRNLGT
jgi:hypothetical protein